MSASTPSAPAPVRCGPRSSVFGRPSPELLARARRGYARFLAQTDHGNAEGATDNQQESPR